MYLDGPSSNEMATTLCPLGPLDRTDVPVATQPTGVAAAYFVWAGVAGTRSAHPGARQPAESTHVLAACQRYAPTASPAPLAGMRAMSRFGEGLETETFPMSDLEVGAPAKFRFSRTMRAFFAASARQIRRTALPLLARKRSKQRERPACAPMVPAEIVPDVRTEKTILSPSCLTVAARMSSGHVGATASDALWFDRPLSGEAPAGTENPTATTQIKAPTNTAALLFLWHVFRLLERLLTLHRVSSNASGGSDYGVLGAVLHRTRKGQSELCPFQICCRLFEPGCNS